MDKERRRKQELINEIEQAGLVGPWSWSDQLGHASTIIAYGILRRGEDSEHYEEIIDDILEYVRGQALYIANANEPLKNNGAKMTIDEIRERIEEIKRNHDQIAHELEDKLYADFITFVAESQSSELDELAKEVLKTKELSFSRWYA